MSDLQERLRRAGNLARLQSLIELTRAGSSGALAGWAEHDRHWFTELLSPFAVESHDQHRLAALPKQRAAGAPPIAVVADDLLRTHSSKPEEMVKEFKAIVKLLQKLLGEQATFDDEDVVRMNRIALTLRRRLLEDQPMRRRPGTIERLA